MPLSTSIRTRGCDPDNGRRIVDLPGALDAVNRNHDFDFTRQLRQPSRLDRPDDLVGDQDVAHTRCRVHLGLGQFGAGQANRPGREQSMGHGRRLVGLGVRSPGDPAFSQQPGEHGDVAVQRIQIDYQGRGIEIIDRVFPQTRSRSQTAPVRRDRVNTHNRPIVPVESAIGNSNDCDTILYGNPMWVPTTATRTYPDVTSRLLKK